MNPSAVFKREISLLASGPFRFGLLFFISQVRNQCAESIFLSSEGHCCCVCVCFFFKFLPQIEATSQQQIFADCHKWQKVREFSASLHFAVPLKVLSGFISAE